MKRSIAAVILCIIAVGTTGCGARISKNMASWMGHNSNDLIASWGPPQQTMPDGQGGTILFYSQARQWATPGQATTTHGSVTSSTVYSLPSTYRYNAHRMFWVDRKGKIYRWSWKGF